jgi:hypothetical protein
MLPQTIRTTVVGGNSTVKVQLKDALLSSTGAVLTPILDYK